MSSNAQGARGLKCFLFRVRQRIGWVSFFTFGCLFAPQLEAAAQIPPYPPTAFFTNVAGRLLKSQLHLDLNHIQVYPTNQYTPAVHRLLQVAANLYDSTTNRCFNGTCSAPYCPSVFRPLFRRKDTPNGPQVFIVGYREASGIDLAYPVLAPTMVYLEDGADQALAIPPIGMPPSGMERTEPLVGGIPLVLGTRKGFPNFNEFAMQTYVLVSRLLEFRRETLDGPVTLTNQMYTLMLSNLFGVEAWNSYSNAYPRGLQLLTTLDLTTMVTNIDDQGQSSVILSNRYSLTLSTNIDAGDWPGWASLNQLQPSFVLPFSNGSSQIVTNASFINQPPFLVPRTHEFSQGTGFYVPHWWLGLNVRLRFVLVDTEALRIVDYVNLDHWEPPVDITTTLTTWADCSGILSDLGPEGQWCTNRPGDSSDPLVPTIGVLNQILFGLGAVNLSLRDYLLDPFSGNDAESAIDAFRVNLMWWPPKFNPGQVYYRSNIFYAPLCAYVPIYIHTAWQANDPFVHYMADDLGASSLAGELGRVDFSSRNPPLSDLGHITSRYEPWGGNPFRGQSLSGMSAYELGAKDSPVRRSDDWDFPTNQPLNIASLGRVHRGTPWQTLFLKSTNILAKTDSPLQDLTNWQKWTGNVQWHPDWTGGDTLVADAAVTAPTNDWALISLLAPLLNTNPVASLASVNQGSAQGWAGLLDGMLVLTNPAWGELDPLILTSNSPLAQAIGIGLDTARRAHPGGVFFGVGDILSAPELSTAAPWLNTTPWLSSDAAFEVLASQLLGRLRPDSVGSVNTLNTNGASEVVFTGIDDFQYALEQSTNFTNWSTISTVYPTNGLLRLPVGNAGPSGAFFRTRLLPGQ